MTHNFIYNNLRYVTAFTVILVVAFPDLTSFKYSNLFKETETELIAMKWLILIRERNSILFGILSAKPRCDIGHTVEIDKCLLIVRMQEVQCRTPSRRTVGLWRLRCGRPSRLHSSLHRSWHHIPQHHIPH